MNLGNWEIYTAKALEFAAMMGRDFGSLKDQEASVQSSVLLLHVAVSGLANAIQDASKADDKKALQAMLKTLRDKGRRFTRIRWNFPSVLMIRTPLCWRLWIEIG